MADRITPTVLREAVVEDSGPKRTRIGLGSAFIIDIKTLALVVVAIVGSVWAGAIKAGSLADKIDRADVRSHVNAKEISAMPTRDEIRSAVRAEVAEGLARIRFRCQRLRNGALDCAAWVAELE